jgi:hypothetical protein
MSLADERKRDIEALPKRPSVLARVIENLTQNILRVSFGSARQQRIQFLAESFLPFVQWKAPRNCSPYFLHAQFRVNGMGHVEISWTSG